MKKLLVPVTVAVLLGVSMGFLGSLAAEAG